MTCPTATAIGTLHTFANADWCEIHAKIAEHGPIDWATQNSAKGRDAYGAASGDGGFSLLPSLTDSPGASASGAFSGDAMTWEECVAAGMSNQEAARAMGKSPTSATRAAKRLGIQWRDARGDASARANMRKHALVTFNRPDVKAKRNAAIKARAADPDRNPLARLTPQERADYDVFRKKCKYTRAAALSAIGREDIDAKSNSLGHSGCPSPARPAGKLNTRRLEATHSKRVLEPIGAGGVRNTDPASCGGAE